MLTMQEMAGVRWPVRKVTDPATARHLGASRVKVAGIFCIATVSRSSTVPASGVAKLESGAKSNL